MRETASLINNGIIDKIAYGTLNDAVEKACQAEKETKEQQEEQTKILTKYQNGMKESSKKLCDGLLTRR